jgi:hypothetical protein
MSLNGSIKSTLVHVCTTIRHAFHLLYLGEQVIPGGRQPRPVRASAAQDRHECLPALLNLRGTHSFFSSVFPDRVRRSVSTARMGHFPTLSIQRTVPP